MKWMECLQFFSINFRNLKRMFLVQIFLTLGICVFFCTVYLRTFENCGTVYEKTHDWSAKLMNLSSITYNPDNFIVPLPTYLSSSPLLTIIICSSASNFAARQAIRQTWGNRKNISQDVEVFFLVGRSTNFVTDGMMYEEKKDYLDIIHYDFLDTYFNLTLKSMMMLDFVRYFRNNSKYIMKTDDDTFVNVKQLRSYLQVSGKPKHLFGHLIVNALPERNPCSKWYIPKEFYSGSIYPNYLSGSAYVMAQDSAQLMQKQIRHVSFFPYEDIFVTGLVSRISGLDPEHHEGFFYEKPEFVPCRLKQLIAGHRITAKNHFVVWKIVNDPTLMCY